jgi:hypothetical protein
VTDKGCCCCVFLQNIKKKFPMVVQRCNEVVSHAAKLGPEASIDVDQLALRVTLDVIGLVRGGHSEPAWVLHLQLLLLSSQQHGWPPACVCDSVNNCRMLQAPLPSLQQVTTSVASEPAGAVVPVCRLASTTTTAVCTRMCQSTSTSSVCCPAASLRSCCALPTPCAPSSPHGSRVATRWAQTRTHGFALATCLQSCPASVGPALVNWTVLTCT